MTADNASVSQEEAEPIRVEMSLASVQIMLGEPLILHYKMINTTSVEVDTYTGRDWKEWLRLALRDEAGQVVPPVPDPRIEQGGVFSDGISLAPGRRYEGFVTLTQRLAIACAGRHQLSVSVHLPYAMGQHQGIRVNQYEEMFGTALDREFLFSFTVMEADPERLRAMAERLRDAVAYQGSPEWVGWGMSNEALEALFSMPEEYALPSWQAVVADRRLLLDRQTIASELERIGSLAAARLLADMYWNPPPEVLASSGLMPAPSVSIQFYGLCSHANPPVREYLVQNFREHGREFS